MKRTVLAARTVAAPAPHDHVATLGNGVRVVVFPEPRLATAAVSIFVRAGSQHESARQNGISHLIEHMAFKGTRTRDCQTINLDAERLGAEVNAHTDKDHTAFHMHGHGRDAADFVRMLGDIVRNSTFPEAELERERQVLLHEYAEDDDDPMATAFKLFDRASFGTHAVARPVIGSRANIRRLTRQELVTFMQRHYTARNTVVGVAGPVEPAAMIAAAEAAFGDMPAGDANGIAAPAYVGGFRSRRLAGCGQAHVVVGFPIPALPQAHQAFVVAAALLGEGMSSPLLDELRERRSLVYHADCSADVRDLYGQFVIEASTTPEHLPEYFAQVTRLLHEQARVADAVALERARNQIEVRSLRTEEDPAQRLELAARELYALGRLRSRAERLEAITAVGPAEVRGAFARMLEAGAAVALAGKIGRDGADLAAGLLRPPRSRAD